MWSFLKKDILVLIRERNELMILILMPVILISILGFALRGIWSDDGEILHMNMAIVSQDQEQAGIEAFEAEVTQLTLPKEAKMEMIAASEDILPNTLLKKVFQTDKVENMIHTTEMSKAQAIKALEQKEIAAIVILPEDFTLHTLKKMFLLEGSGSQIELIVEEEGSVKASIAKQVVEEFSRSLNFQAAVAAVTDKKLNVMEEPAESLGGTITIASNDKPISAMQYYTIGMSVMFVLYVASMIGSKAYIEKSQHVFNRIILSGKSPIIYLSSKFVSTTSIVMLQLFVLISISTFLFQSFKGYSISFWFGMIFISFLLACSVGAFGAVLSALSVRMHSNHVNAIFSGGITTIFAFLGGSFFPTAQLPDFIRRIGEWTPNGAALSAYIQWMQGVSLSNLNFLFIKLVIISLILFLLSMVIFPKRRSSV
ncbi:ABC-2 family transporter protein [Paraliobacillus sp. PM-2]|uniref:ABC transporter permease n=1 Tax=Paraliobacillus sp. PM-2 TaxID=1462524 RepID=UPI00061BF16B|nr:ABC transporter permease [Paraliobacillus sp. PM-2]CQR48415.1 ABC-2 family transporter protein [Paraliobacillus sp. PM-2]